MIAAPDSGYWDAGSERPALRGHRFWLFGMPPAAAVKADVLKNSGAGHQVNPGLRPKAALAFLAALKVLDVFLCHKRLKNKYLDGDLSISLSLHPCAIV
jgi:hypothetical protein